MWRREAVFALGALMLASACGPGGASSGPDGAVLYAATCAACHGEALLAHGAMADLRYYGGSYEEFVSKLNEGGDLMPSYEGAFSEAELRALHAYVRANAAPG